MKYLSVLLLGAASSVRGLDTSRWLQMAALEGFGNSGCTECFDKIDLARDCLRECNQNAHPEDSCCCCCQCDKVDVREDGTSLPGDDGQCDSKDNNDKCDSSYGDNCKWDFDDQADRNNHNKWYNLEDYCDCDHNNNDFNSNDNCKDDDRKTNDRSLLDFCLDGSEKIDGIESISDLQECCDFQDNKCDQYFQEVQECLVGCINPCLITSAGAWLDCLRDQGDNGHCTQTACLDGFLEEVPQDLGVDNNPDIFDLDSVFKMVEKIETENLEDCSLLKEFVDDVCDVSNDCCDRCSGEVGATVDCLINGVVVPFAEGALNATIGECPIDTERCQAAFRRLEETTVTGESSEAASRCQAIMQTNIMVHNMSYATNQFMECLMKEGFQALPDADAEQAANTGSGAFALFSMVTAALSIVTALMI